MTDCFDDCIINIGPVIFRFKKTQLSVSKNSIFHLAVL